MIELLPSIITYDEFLRRVKIATESDTHGKNCLGTQMYIQGLVDIDEKISTHKAPIVNCFTEVRRELSSVITFESSSLKQRAIYHIMVIDPQNRRRVYHRLGPNAKVIHSGTDYAIDRTLTAAEEIPLVPKYCAFDAAKVYDCFVRTKFLKPGLFLEEWLNQLK
jgi:hypothetical protein